MKTIELLEDGIYNCPLVLLSIKDKSLIDIINNYLPYSIGIEIECDQAPHFDVSNFTNIPDIMDVRVDSTEQRFRIPNGLSGLICLYNVCKELKSNSELNPLSGHHYHIDMTNTYHLLTHDFVENNAKWMLNELDSWGYIGTFNARKINFTTQHNWVRFQSEFKTAEIRIGNMTFDYKTIITRLIHACTIIRRLNNQLIINPTIIYSEPSVEKIKSRIKYASADPKLRYLSNRLAELTTVINISTTEEQKQIVKKRIIKI